MRIFRVNNNTDHKYDVLRVITKFYRDDLDRTERDYNPKSAEISYKNFLIEKIKNPVAADAVLMDCLNKQPIKHIYYFYTFKEQLEKLPNIAKLINKIQKIEESHSKTGYLREVLMANNRIKPDYVTQKLSGLRKILLKSKIV